MCGAARSRGSKRVECVILPHTITQRIMIENQQFEKIDYTQQPRLLEQFECCTFVGCTFTNVDISNSEFTECEFRNCNLSMVTVKNTAFKEVRFVNCKILGVNFGQCSEFLLQWYFEDCILNNTSFHKLNIKNTIFKNCSIQEADFTETNAQNVAFDNCDLLNTLFDFTNLEKADFRTAYNYALDPETNKIAKAKFSLQGVVGLLYKYNISIT